FCQFRHRHPHGLRVATMSPPKRKSAAMSATHVNAKSNNFKWLGMMGNDEERSGYPEIHPHNLKVVGSNPTPATTVTCTPASNEPGCFFVQRPRMAARLPTR